MPFSHGGNVYDGEGILQNWIDVSANINPLGLSEPVKEAIITAVDML
ncbi:MAG: threonine-phosphate decarboxylase, partial [Megasphaera micronuciformis]|nr:threonine-phosphate decarboxylase [Megasphaera micronuciformis]